MSKNFAASLVVTGPSPSNSGLTLTVTTGTGSKLAAGPAVLSPPDGSTHEIVTIASVSTDTITLSARAAESTTALSVQAGWSISQGLTAGQYDTLAATVAAVPGTYGPGSTQWLQSIGGGFGFGFATITVTDTGTGLPTTGTVRWPDGTGGNFTGTIDGGGNGYSGYAVTWTGSTTRTLTASGITYDTAGNPIGPTGLVVS